VVKRRVLLVGLDGFELSLAERYIAEGALPALAAMGARSARFRLDHGDAKRSGLAWEHVSTGLSPADAGRHAAVTFDPASYAVWQDGTSLAPFPAGLPARTVVFDPPYFDLARAPDTRGIVGWGAHDPGIASAAVPKELGSEFRDRFGTYLAQDWIYGLTWPCAQKSAVMADRLVRAVEMRADAAGWLLGERLPDWDLGIVVVSELHSGIEAFWHGIDPMHPLHRLPSAGPAADGVQRLYQAVDRLIGGLAERFDDATIVVFAAHGMGPNGADLPSMLLLPELLYRHATGRRLFRAPDSWTGAADGLPMLAANESWGEAVGAALGQWPALTALRRRLARRLGARSNGTDAANHRVSLDWMPAAAYRRHWPAMPAFALPSFYDGRVRINLAGRERNGRVPSEQYAAACDEIEELIRACRDTRTGKPVAGRIERAGGDPRRLGPTEADLVVDWDEAPVGFEHPALGRIGPAPYRRTGGHSGPYGFAYLAGDDIAAGDCGICNTFDIVPTIIDLLQLPRPARLSGTSRAAALARAPHSPARERAGERAWPSR